jgi:hypothetical protein
MALVAQVARELWASWRTGGRSAPPRQPAPGLEAPLPPSVRVRRPEGFALYALYPEAYAWAARGVAGRRDLTTVGIRSIGTSLAAMVAAGAGAGTVPFTVRPTGHPYARDAELSPALLREIARRPAGAFAIVDEGPGLSGESFASVARALLGAGVAAARIHLFPGHAAPPGAEASPATRALFSALERHFVPFERLLLAGGPLGLTRLAEDVIGPAEIADDLTEGKWRRRLFADERDWPPSEGWLERRKLVLAAAGRRHLARFAGIGAHGEGKLARAVALADAGVGIRPEALRHGFLFEPWLDAARPLPAATVARTALVDAIGRLVRVSAARPRSASDGASPEELVEMTRVNAAEALGAAAGEAARRLEDLLPEVARQARPVEVDGKMQRWEWLVLPDGRLLKADAVDHHAAHDLGGCQDALWDVAGAELELGLSSGEALRLAEAARAVGPGADPALLPFYRTCLAALEVGRWWFAARSAPTPAERGRCDGALARYRRALGRELVSLRRARRPVQPVPAAASGGGPDRS